MTISSDAKKAIKIGGVCAVAYLAVYIARNILSTVSPQMIEGGFMTTESVGTLSSLFFISYAVGQLINGMIGDKIKAKYMISFGLIFAGITNLVFPYVTGSVMLTNVTYGLCGFFLSMIYGPMTKVVAENTKDIYTTRCSLGYTFSSFFGSPLAGVLAAAMSWKWVFISSSGVLLAMGVCCLVVFLVLEKKGDIEYNKYKKPEKSGSGVKILIKHQIIKYTLISVITGVVRTTVVFWLPTYISQYLKFSPDNSAVIFTVATFAISMTAFIAIFVYERLGHNMELTILLAFSSATICFAMVYFMKHPVLNIIFMVLAIISSNSAASMLWSRYCPSLKDTGMVSSATGFLDFMSYSSASVSSTIFANAVSKIGWGNLILIWLGLMVLGIIVAIPYKGFKHHE